MSPVPAGTRPFPTLSLHPLRRRLDPYPAVPLECSHPALPRGHRPRARGTALGGRDCPCHATSTGSRISGRQSFASLQAPTLARPPDCTDRSTTGAEPLGRLHHASPGWLPTPGCGIATCPLWAFDTAGLSPAGLQSCRLLLPQYGFKASLSDRACPQRCTVKLAPSMPVPQCGLRHPSPASAPERLPGSVSKLVHASTGRCARGPASLPQGSLAPVRVLLSRSITAYYDPIRQSRRHAATSRLCRLYAAPSLCGSAEATNETFPTFTAVLSTRAADPTPVGPTRRSRCVHASGTRLPRTIIESPPTKPVSASNT